MPGYICHNPQCELFEKERREGRVTLRYTREGVIDSGIPCPKCGQDAEALDEKGMTTVMLGSNNICKK